MSWEIGIPMAEIDGSLGVGTSAIAMAIRKIERGISFQSLVQRPLGLVNKNGLGFHGEYFS